MLLLVNLYLHLVFAVAGQVGVGRRKWRVYVMMRLKDQSF